MTTTTEFVMPPTRRVPHDGTVAEDGQPKGPPLKNIKVRSATARQLAEVAEATGQTVWGVVEELLGVGLATYHKAVQPQLKKVRELEAQKSKVQQQAPRHDR